MYIGTSLVLLAAGAILRFAITGNVSGVNLPVVGDVLMAIGVLGLIISGIYEASRRRPVYRDREVVREVPPPVYRERTYVDPADPAGPPYDRRY